MRTQTSVDGGMEHGASPREGRSKCDEVALHDRGAWSLERRACAQRLSFFQPGRSEQPSTGPPKC